MSVVKFVKFLNQMSAQNKLLAESVMTGFNTMYPLMEATLQNACENCGEKITDPHNCYCTECGEKLDDDLDVGDEKAALEYLKKREPEAPNYCEECGAPIDADDNYCCVCGTKIDTEQYRQNAKNNLDKEIISTVLDTVRSGLKVDDPNALKFGMKNGLFVIKIAFSDMLKSLKDANNGQDLEGIERHTFTQMVEKELARLNKKSKRYGEFIKVINGDVYVCFTPNKISKASARVTDALITAFIASTAAVTGCNFIKDRIKRGDTISEEEKNDFRKADELYKNCVRLLDEHKFEQYDIEYKKYIEFRDAITAKWMKCHSDSQKAYLEKQEAEHNKKMQELQAKYKQEADQLRDSVK